MAGCEVSVPLVGAATPKGCGATPTAVWLRSAWVMPPDPFRLQKPDHEAKPWTDWNAATLAGYGSRIGYSFFGYAPGTVTDAAACQFMTMRSTAAQASYNWRARHYIDHIYNEVPHWRTLPLNTLPAQVLPPDVEEVY